MLQQRAGGDDAVGYEKDDETGDSDAHGNGRKCPFKAHIQKRGDQRASPCARARERYRNEDKKSPKAVLLHLLCAL